MYLARCRRAIAWTRTPRGYDDRRSVTTTRVRFLAPSSAARVSHTGHQLCHRPCPRIDCSPTENPVVGTCETRSPSNSEVSPSIPNRPAASLIGLLFTHDRIQVVFSFPWNMNFPRRILDRVVFPVGLYSLSLPLLIFLTRRRNRRNGKRPLDLANVAGVTRVSSIHSGRKRYVPRESFYDG